MFVTVGKHQRFKPQSVKRHQSGLNFRPATLKRRVLVISKLLTIYFKLRVTMFLAV